MHPPQGQPEPEREPSSVVVRRVSGLAIAALAIGVFTLVGAVAAWAVWLIARLSSGTASFGWFAYAPLAQHADYLSIPSYPEFFALVGPTWFAVLPVASVGLVFARAVRVRERPAAGRVPGVRASTITAVAALVLAIVGLVLFAVDPTA